MDDVGVRGGAVDPRQQRDQLAHAEQPVDLTSQVAVVTTVDHPTTAAQPGLDLRHVGRMVGSGPDRAPDRVAVEQTGRELRVWTTTR